MLRATVEKDFSFPETAMCPSPDDCDSKSFSVVAGSELHKDHQELKVQEQAQKLEFGSIPRSIAVVLEDDLVDTTKAGDGVTISGTVVRRWKPMQRDER